MGSPLDDELRIPSYDGGPDLCVEAKGRVLWIDIDEIGSESVAALNLAGVTALRDRCDAFIREHAPKHCAEDLTDLIAAGDVLVSVGTGLVVLARAIRRDRDVEGHADPAPAAERKAAHDDLEAARVVTISLDFEAARDAAYQRTVDTAVSYGTSRERAERLVNAIRAGRDPNAN